ncbi:AraC family transcriptional regulator [Vibrio sp. WXL103]|uniref:AraC family transcriptional regulator n=1 Tax=Vibrio sp. WXL103 TaxID=3450710 RepID=UPI003EC7505F
MKKILVLLDVMVFYDREVFRGIQSSFNSRDEEVTIYLSCESNLEKLYQDKWDVVIADGDKLSNLNAISQLANKCLVYSSYRLADVPKQVTTLEINSHQIAELALGKFISMGIDQVAFFANEFDRPFAWSDERQVAFVEKAAELGLNMVDINCSTSYLGSKKTGVLCSTDRSARSLIQKMCDLGVAVPQHVSIIGIDCDPIENEISPISISSIAIEPFEIGKQAAEISQLNRQTRQHYYVPWKLVEHESCRGQEEQDSLVSKALYYIHTNYQNNIKVNDVACYCRVSRKTLDNRFIASKARTVHQYIADKRLEKCKQLLSETKQSIEDIALQCGYPHQSYLYQVFKKNIDCTPLEYRNSLQAS